MAMWWNIFGKINMDFLNEEIDDLDISEEMLMMGMQPDNDNSSSSISIDESTQRSERPRNRRRRARVELGINRESTQEGGGGGHVWICLPGSHPLKVKWSVVQENKFERYIIYKAKQLKQIRMYRKKGFVRSLFSCCETTEELMDELSMMQSPESPSLWVE